MAGEGIEYSWDVAKRIYRKYSLRNKKTMKQFIHIVKVCLQRVSKEMCQKFSSKARSYMLTYKHLSMLESEGKTNDNSCCLEINEKVYKSYRSHRDTNIIEGLFIQKVMKECITID